MKNAFSGKWGKDLFMKEGFMHFWPIMG